MTGTRRALRRVRPPAESGGLGDDLGSGDRRRGAGAGCGDVSAVGSSSRSARIAEQAPQEQRRPVLMNARLDDPAQKVMFVDGHWIRVEGSQVVVVDWASEWLDHVERELE